MKIRNGFVSNSSSSSFVLIKDVLNPIQIDMILDYHYYVNEIMKSETIDESIKNKFEYFDEWLWRITEFDDFLFGTCDMDNFSFSDYLEYINVDEKYIKWDDGYIDNPTQSQIDSINKMKIYIRRDKINNINNIKKDKEYDSNL